MAVYQTSLWVCEACDAVASTSEITSQHSDPVVTPPNGEEWGFYGLDERLLCPKCLSRLEAGA